jgi:hypothetical protein
VEHTTLAEMVRGLSQSNEPLEASAWQELQRACHALGGVGGPRRRVAKQELTAALERRQRTSVDSRSPAGLKGESAG